MTTLPGHLVRTSTVRTMPPAPGRRLRLRRLLALTGPAAGAVGLAFGAPVGAHVLAVSCTKATIGRESSAQ